MKKKKLRCPNCGTVIKEEELSCPVCHMVVERPKEDVEEQEEEAVEEVSFSFKEEFPIGKIVMIFLIVVGIILTIKGTVELQNESEFENNVRSLFFAGFGIVLIISASITLARSEKKFKIKG